MPRISPFQSGREMSSFARAAVGDDLLKQLAVADTRERELAGALHYDPWHHTTPQTVSPILEDPDYRVPLGPWGNRSRFANLMGSNSGDPQVVASAGAGAHRLPPSVPGADLSEMEARAMARLNPPPTSKTPPVLKTQRQDDVITSLRQDVDDHHWDYTPDPELSMADLAALDGDDPHISIYDSEALASLPFGTLPSGTLRERERASYDEPPSFSPPPQQPFTPTQPRLSTSYSNAGVGQTDTVGSSSPPPPPPMSWGQQAWQGLKRGLQFGVGDGGHYSKSVVSDRAPDAEYQDLGGVGQGTYAAGRVGADVIGHGTRKVFWTITPEDIVGTYGKKFLEEQGVPRIAQLGGSYGATVALGIGSGNFNPLNIAEGGRAAGYQANNPTDEDPRKSNSPIYDMVVERGLLGRRGRLLPWEQFHQERPDVSYDTYAKYQDYQRNKNPGLLNKATLGLVKGTTDGINGPELSIMGYGVTPLGAAAALGTLAATAYGAKRIASLR